MAADAAEVGLPPLDGRDLSRIRTEVRLAHLALGGLLAEEDDGFDTGGTPEPVLKWLAGALTDLEAAVEKLGGALAALNESA